ncbi:MAG: arsenite methyltransferase [Bacteroidetes bacterium]|nr:arsenite methyltransferase [Bacteroidota bacterium]
MSIEQEVKEIVKEKYGAIAQQISSQKKSCCCGTREPLDFSIMAEDYTKLSGYSPEADLKLGCGIPTEYANIKSGDTVVDLGSGAGNDAFVARSIVGDTGRVIGIDMTEPMIEKARKNTNALGFTNVEFQLGDIENIPVEENIADVVISNCVMNLVPNKQQAFSETFRILKHGGHFSISDIVLVGELPTDFKREAALYAGCVSGAVQQEEYLAVINNSGFKNIVVQKQRAIELPEEILQQYLSKDKLEEFVRHKIGIFSITVYAEKP